MNARRLIETMLVGLRRGDGVLVLVRVRALLDKPAVAHESNLLLLESRGSKAAVDVVGGAGDVAAGILGEQQQGCADEF